MALMTIGRFARACQLTPKALRRYAELGLLVPARTDPFTGYRWYTTAQLDRARLVAWLRRIGMPLARIATVCELGPVEASAEVAAYWAQVEAETDARRELVGFLVGYMSRGGPDMNRTPLRLRWATYCDRGLVREHNQDAYWAGEGLLGVADGFGTHPTGTALPSATAGERRAASGALCRDQRAEVGVRGHPHVRAGPDRR